MKDGMIMPVRYVDARTLAWILYIQSVLKGFGEYAFISTNENFPHKPGSAKKHHRIAPAT